jgi:catalase (peroxidase I)
VHGPAAAVEGLESAAEEGEPARPEKTVLVGGLRVLSAIYDKPDPGAFAATPGSLGTTWQPTAQHVNTVEGRGAATGEVKWTGSAGSTWSSTRTPSCPA